ncbi:hypothetical protein AAHH87_00755 [Candidatus Hodgkinia cicadicola]
MNTPSTSCPEYRLLPPPEKLQKLRKRVETLYNVLQNRTNRSRKLSGITNQLALSNCLMFELLIRSKRLARWPRAALQPKSGLKSLNSVALALGWCPNWM